MQILNRQVLKIHGEILTTSADERRKEKKSQDSVSHGSSPPDMRHTLISLLCFDAIKSVSNLVAATRRHLTEPRGSVK